MFGNREGLASAWADALASLLTCWGLLPQPVPVRVNRRQPRRGLH